MNQFGVKGESSVLSKFKVNELREYAMINGISPLDSKNKPLAKDKLFARIKSYFANKRKDLEENTGVMYTPWDITHISTMKPFAFKRVQTMITTQDLLDSLPDVPLPPSRRLGPSYTQMRMVPQEEFVPQYRRMPPGSKVIRKETGMTKTEKTQMRRQIQSQIDDLSDLLASLN